MLIIFNNSSLSIEMIISKFEMFLLTVPRAPQRGLVGGTKPNVKLLTVAMVFVVKRVPNLLMSGYQYRFTMIISTSPDLPPHNF